MISLVYFTVYKQVVKQLEGGKLLVTIDRIKDSIQEKEFYMTRLY